MNTRRLLPAAVCALWAAVASAALQPGGWEPSVRERLDALIDRNRGNPDAYAVFDFDYTTAIGDLSYVCIWHILERLDFKVDDWRGLLTGGVAPCLGDEAGKLAEIAEKLRPLSGTDLTANKEWCDFIRRYWALYRRLGDEVGEAAACSWRTRVFTGYTPADLRRLAKTAAMQAIASGKGLHRDANASTEKRGFAIAPEMKNLFAELREAGITVYFVSGSFQEALAAMTSPEFGLGIPEDNVFGADLQQDAAGRYMPTAKEGCVQSGRKPEFIREHIASRHHGAEPVLAAGDSMGDYTMLTEFDSLQLALLFARNWKEPEMHALADGGGRVAVQGRDETRGCFVPSARSIEPPRAARLRSWDSGEPVTTYWFGPGCPGQNEPLTDFWAKQLKEGGFNTVWANTPEELDIAAKYGLRAIYSIDPSTEWAKVDLDNADRRAALAERINRVKDHPALYVYEHYDEAPAEMFAELARVKDFVCGLDPAHPCWHNLLPMYASNRQLGVGGKAGEPQRLGFGYDKAAAYAEHVRLFCDIYQPSFITYDHYQMRTEGDTRNYFLNLGIVRQNAAARGVPFWNGLQACSWVPGSLASPRSPRIPTVDEMRYLAHTTAAYGASGLYWYVYCRADHDGTIAAADGTVGEKYEGVKKINREFIAFSRILSRLSFKGAFLHGVHAPGTTPYCDRALLKLSPQTPQSEVEDGSRHVDTTLVTRFEDENGRVYLMAVNCDYRKRRVIHAESPCASEVFDPEAGGWSYAGTSFDLDLACGGGVIIRLQPGTKALRSRP